MSKKIISDYYNSNADREWKRLKRHLVNELEFETTKRYVEKYVKKQDYVLDIGGGPGRYTFWLAEKGNKVYLADYSDGLIAKAGKVYKRLPKQIKNNITGMQIGDVRDLKNFKISQFDVTLCLGGVISHVTNKEDRLKALKELQRVTKKEGYIFVSVIGLLAVIRDEIYGKYVDDLKKSFAEVKKICIDGDYHGKAGFTAAHFFRIDELQKTVKSVGLEVVEMVALEGFASSLEKELAVISKEPDAWGNLIKIIQYYEKDPSVIDNSEHVLIICKNTK